MSFEKFPELAVFDFFVDQKCGNGRDLTLIRTLNEMDKKLFDPTSADSIRNRIFEIDGFTESQRFCFAKESLAEKFQILAKKNELIQLFPIQEQSVVFEKIRNLWSEADIIAETLSDEISISYSEILRKASKFFVLRFFKNRSHLYKLRQRKTVLENFRKFMTQERHFRILI